MTLLKNIIIRYALTILFISSSGYTVNLHGSEAESISKIKWGLSTRQGKRPFMEDRHSVESLDNLHFFGVYDGHGGTGAAEFVKEHLHENFFKAKGETIEERLTSVFLKTDKDFLDDPLFKNDKSGTTVVVAVVDTSTNKLFIANTGDSRAIVIREDKVLLTTEDHKPDTPSERKRIEDAGGSVNCDFPDCFRVCGILAVSRAIGDRDLKKWVIPNPDIYEASLKKDDFLVLACDGVWDVMTNEDVANFVHKKFNEQGGKSLPTYDSGGVADDGDERIKLVARALRNEAYYKGSKDNISVLIVKVESLSWSEKLFQSINAKKSIFLSLGGVVAIFCFLYRLGYFSFL